MIFIHKIVVHTILKTSLPLENAVLVNLITTLITIRAITTITVMAAMMPMATTLKSHIVMTTTVSTTIMITFTIMDLVMTTMVMKNQSMKITPKVQLVRSDGSVLTRGVKTGLTKPAPQILNAMDQQLNAVSPFW